MDSTKVKFTAGGGLKRNNKSALNVNTSGPYFKFIIHSKTSLGKCRPVYKHSRFRLADEHNTYVYKRKI